MIPPESGARQDPAGSLPLSYGRFTVALKPEAPLALPAYAGAMFRGAFGIALKRVVCVTRTYDCPPCVLKDRCIYPYVFDTPPPEDTQVMRKYTAAPHPFVLEPPRGGARLTQEGEVLPLGLTLFGKAIRYLPYFIFAFERLGHMGLGRRRVRCSVQEVQASLGQSNWTLYSSVDRELRASDAFEISVGLPGRPVESERASCSAQRRVSVELLTPLRVVFEGRLAPELPFHVLVRNLVRRMGHLSYFHCGGDPTQFAFREWIARAATVRTISEELEWFDWERYSLRQQTRMSLGGLVGTVTYEGELEPFLPLLQIGEVTHVGKGTSFGLGQFRILKVE